jgi:hypothetical protein
MALENPITSDDLTIDFATLLDLSVSNRVQAAASDNTFAQALIASLTPIQMAKAFPDYYRKQLPDISNFILANRYLDETGKGAFDQQGGGDPGEDKAFYDGETAVPAGQNPAGVPEVTAEQMREKLLEKGIDVGGTLEFIGTEGKLLSDPKLTHLNDLTPEQLSKAGLEVSATDEGKKVIRTTAIPEMTDEQAVTSMREQAAKAQTGVVAPGSLADTLQTGEVFGSVKAAGKAYQSYNKGVAHGYKAGTMDLEKTPLSEVMRLQNLPKNHPDKLFAVGAYQVIPDTMKAAVTALGLDPDKTTYDAATQTKIMAWLTTEKPGRKGIGDFIRGDSDDILKAQEQMAQEWASMASVSKGGKSYYSDGVNKAKISLEQTRAALEDAKKRYKENIALGMDPQIAYESALTGVTSQAVDPEKQFTPEEISKHKVEVAEKKKLERENSLVESVYDKKVSPTSLEYDPTTQGNALMAQGDLENINYTSAPETSTAATGYTGSGTSATKVSEDYVNNQFLGAADFMTGVGIWPGGENPYFSESTSGKYRFDPKGGIGIDPVHKGQGHYGFKGQLAYDISVARMVQQAKDAGVKLSERDAHNVVTSMRDFLREQTGGAAGGTQEQKGQLGELYGPERGVMREKTGESGHYRHMHYAPGTNLQRGDYNQMLQTLLSNPSALNDPKTGNPSKTAARLLADLEKAKFVVKKEDGTYARNDAIMPKQMKTALGMDKPKVQVAEVKPEAITPATPSVTENTVFIGDSIAHGLKDAAKGEGNTKVGRKPSEVLSEMEKMGPESFKGKKVVLSTGLSNDTADLESVRKQMQFLKDAGADVQIAGMSNSREDLAPGNQQLQQLSSEYGYSFMGGFDAGKDKIHPTSYGKYAAAAAESIQAAEATPAAEAPAVLTTPTNHVAGRDDSTPVQAAEATPAAEAPATPLMADTVASGLADYDPSKVSAASLGAAKFGVTPESKKRMIESIEAQKSDSEKKESTMITPTNHVAGRDDSTPVQAAEAVPVIEKTAPTTTTVVAPKPQVETPAAPATPKAETPAPIAETPAAPATPKAETPAPIKSAEATPAPVQVTEAIPAPTGRPEEVRKFRTGGSPDVQDDENLSVFDEDGSLKWKMNSGEGIYVKPKDTEYADDKIDELSDRVDDIDQRSDTPEKNQPKAAPDKDGGRPEKNWQQNASTVTYSIGSQGRAFKRTKFQNEGFHFNRSAPNSTSS